MLFNELKYFINTYLLKIHKFNLLNNCYLNKYFLFIFYKNGNWGLGIGDWAQSTIHNPQSPFAAIILSLNVFNKNLKLNKK